MPTYPNIVIELSGHDYDAHTVLAMVTRKMKEAGIDNSQIEQYFRQATYHMHKVTLLNVTKNWVTVI